MKGDESYKLPSVLTLDAELFLFFFPDNFKTMYVSWYALSWTFLGNGNLKNSMNLKRFGLETCWVGLFLSKR